MGDEGFGKVTDGVMTFVDEVAAGLACWPSVKSRIVQTRPPTRCRASITRTSAPSLEQLVRGAQTGQPGPGNEHGDPGQLVGHPVLSPRILTNVVRNARGRISG